MEENNENSKSKFYKENIITKKGFFENISNTNVFTIIFNFLSLKDFFSLYLTNKTLHKIIDKKYIRYWNKKYTKYVLKENNLIELFKKIKLVTKKFNEGITFKEREYAIIKLIHKFNNNLTLTRNNFRFFNIEIIQICLNKKIKSININTLLLKDFRLQINNLIDLSVENSYIKIESLIQIFNNNKKIRNLLMIKNTIDDETKNKANEFRNSLNSLEYISNICIEDNYLDNNTILSFKLKIIDLMKNYKSDCFINLETDKFSSNKFNKLFNYEFIKSNNELFKIIKGIEKNDIIIFLKIGIDYDYNNITNTDNYYLKKACYLIFDWVSDNYLNMYYINEIPNENLNIENKFKKLNDNLYFIKMNILNKITPFCRDFLCKNFRKINDYSFNENLIIKDINKLSFNFENIKTPLNLLKISKQIQKLIFYFPDVKKLVIGNNNYDVNNYNIIEEKLPYFYDITDHDDNYSIKW